MAPSGPSPLGSPTRETTAEVPPEAFAFYCALAQQCFINEYVLAQTDVETTQAHFLRDALNVELAEGRAVSGLRLLAASCYFPLCSLTNAHKLLEQPWPERVQAVLVQQLLEPAQEQALRASIPQLTPVDNEPLSALDHNHTLRRAR